MADTFFLEPGYIFFSKAATSVRTVLGSCVSVCLWDVRLGHGGMNHFIYPVARQRAQATPRFGNVATLALIRLMERNGSNPEDLAAHIIGGGCQPNGVGAEIGLENARVARKALERRGIRILSEDVGGAMGRKVVFDTQSGQAAVLKVHKIREGDWKPETL
ncbi:MAG: Chemoreceptor glutamine deamidase CheD [candidate division BRC1 bacterium ADurb.BinA364]|nr:MAG: Chemoreceptor glutamine deamidase CheD [candidate division BRC1 bacterium ADurb.BinA364]